MITEATVAELVREICSEWLDPAYTDIGDVRVKVTLASSKAGKLAIDVHPSVDGMFAYPGERYELTITAKRAD